MKQRILDYMQMFGSINTKQAFVDLGCTRLSEYIRQIREERIVYDWWVKGKNRFQENVHWKEYYLDEENQI